MREGGISNFSTFIQKMREGGKNSRVNNVLSLWTEDICTFLKILLHRLIFQAHI